MMSAFFLFCFLFVGIICGFSDTADAEEHVNSIDIASIDLLIEKMGLI